MPAIGARARGALLHGAGAHAYRDIRQRENATDTAIERAMAHPVRPDPFRSLPAALFPRRHHAPGYRTTTPLPS